MTQHHQIAENLMIHLCLNAVDALGLCTGFLFNKNLVNSNKSGEYLFQT